ncbi:MAG: DUF4097 family beta strand repeat-containing protein [Bryobacteraceae bacterium]|nr:DUF4097 family beta strand repeat-containing protein [Bryobacteraceae bacterium]
MKPRSIVAPLILIALGVLFLMHNLWPEIPVVDLFSRYWPVLLILWGAVRLGEVLIWHTQAKALPVSGVSGGEWTVIVLLCLVGSGLFWGSRYASRFPAGQITMRGLEIFGEPYEFPVSAAKSVGKAPRIVLEMGRGDARIVGADTDQVQITGRKTIRAFEQADATRSDKQTPLEIVFMGDQVVIRTNQDRVEHNRRISSNLEISIPKGASFEGRGRYGDFDVSGLAGNVEISSDNAGVRVQNVEGSVKVDLRRSDIVRAVNVKGPVEVKGRGQDLELESIEGLVTVNADFTGEVSFRNLAKPLRFESSRTALRAEKIPGSVRFASGNIIGEKVAGPIVLNTRSRDVQFREFTDGAEVTVDRGDIELRPLAQFGKLDVRTSNGNVDFVVPPGARFDLSAKTSRGEIINDYGAPLREESEDKGGSLKGSVGSGPQVSLTTERGSITVRNVGSPAPAQQTGSVPPAPPTAPLPPVPALQRQ